MSDPLAESVQYLRGVGPRVAETLARLGVRTVYDLLFTLPHRYTPRALIRDLRPGAEAAFIGELTEARWKGQGRGRRLVAAFSDRTGDIPAVWFNVPRAVLERLENHRRFLVVGKIDSYGGRQVVAPTVEPLDTAPPAPNVRRGIAGVYAAQPASSSAASRTAPAPPGYVDRPLLPVYPLTAGLSQTTPRRVVFACLPEFAPLLHEYLPDATLAARGWSPLPEAMRRAHFPDTEEAAARARERLVYHEFFLLELLKAGEREAARRTAGPRIRVPESVDNRIRARFPFRFTNAQDRAVAQIARDLASGRRMCRLLQGDVGAGKTAVALYAMLAAVANRRQAVVMAPMEVLASQHYRTISEALAGSRTRVEYLSGAVRGARRREALAAIESGEAHIVIGTHALIEPAVRFRRLGLVVVDEQHKFGVAQREALARKGPAPHFLVMSATPIPRTLSLTVYGELDLTVIDELPPGRRPVRTELRAERDRAAVYAFIRGLIENHGAQAYFVYPLVSESETTALASAEAMSSRLAAGPFRDLGVGLVHGRMPATQKERVMADYRAGRISVLVATVVVEVGVDVPGATVMVVENAERFGLAQLHQLRGRVGRGAEQSYFILFSAARTREARERLAVIAATADGFRIAEEDLRLRGFGDLVGTRQHGIPRLRLSDVERDVRLLETARDDAFAETAAARRAGEIARRYLPLHFPGARLPGA
ncbi:MAG: ATP-dependent DNA helicase RecG [Planctomycetes bacterium]|nr:ATP-dependent DNA helicase RecG [Planctomycetota bacterium]